MRTLTFILLSTLLSSCDSIIPANFWFNFKSDQITKKFSDHGPYGGTTIANWELSGEQLDTDELTQFAEQNNWSYLSTQTEFDFPYYSHELEERLSQFLTEYQIIMTFKTNWMIVEPGTDNSFDALGYIFLDSQRTKMTVFYYWGG
jgi:hypothetical protein